MDCRATLTHEFRTNLGFKRHDINLTKKQSEMTKTLDWYFHDYRLAIEIDKNGHSDRNIDYEIKRQKSIEQELCCKFIRTDTDK